METRCDNQFNIQNSDEMTWNVLPLLHEVRHALARLLECGETSSIDLRSIPLAPGEEEKILQLLGKGEVHATLFALGESKIDETRYPGVWLITHHNDEGQIIGRFIEITTMPDILLSQQADLIDSYEYLDATLKNHSLSDTH